MGSVCFKKMYIVWYNIPVVNNITTNCHSSAIVSSSICRVSITFSFVCSLKSFGNFFLHVPFSIHTDLGFSSLQGPWIIHDFTISYKTQDLHSDLEFLMRLFCQCHYYLSAYLHL